MGKFGIMAGLVPLVTPSLMAQGIQGVRPEDTHPIEIGVGYTFVAFQETGGLSANDSGVNATAIYYDNHVGVEADFTDAYGTQNGQAAQILFGGAGVRYRLPHYRSFQPWVHAVGGYTYLSPKVSLGADDAFGYKLGGGFDVNPRHARIGYRVSADLFGTRYFGTYQLSPEVTVGIVFKVHRK
jgi:hypothetical protein